MAEHATTAIERCGGPPCGAVVPDASSALGIRLTDAVPVLTRVARPWGEPIRCRDCNRAIHPLEYGESGALGRYRCHEHQVRQKYGAGRLAKTAKTSVAKPPKPPTPVRKIGTKVVPTPKPSLPLHEPVPVLPEPPVRMTGSARVTLRERLAARRAAERNQG